MQRTTISKKAISKDYKNVYIYLYEFNEIPKLLEWTTDDCLPELKTRWRCISNDRDEEGGGDLKEQYGGLFLAVFCVSPASLSTPKLLKYAALKHAASGVDKVTGTLGFFALFIPAAREHAIVSWIRSLQWF